MCSEKLSASWRDTGRRNEDPTLKVGVETNSEDVNTVCRPAGRRDGDLFEVDH